MAGNLETETTIGKQAATEPSIVRQEDDLLAPFLQKVSEYELLTEEEETSLGQEIVAMRQELEKAEPKAEIVTQGQQAIKELCQHNLRLTVFFAKIWYRKTGVSFPDLLAVANLAAVEAAHRFDPDKGPFAPCVRQWVLKETTEFLRLNFPVVPSHHAYERKGPYQVVIDQMEKELGRLPTVEEITDRTEAPETENERKRIDLALGKAHHFRNARQSQSMEEIFPESDGLTLADRLHSQTSTPEQLVIKQERDQVFAKTLESLTAQQEIVMRLRFGLNHKAEPLTQEQVGKRLGKTRARVGQIEQEALTRLRQPHRKLKDF